MTRSHSPFGYTFTTTVPYNINALGVWYDGLGYSHAVGIWHSVGNLLVSTTVLPTHTVGWPEWSKDGQYLQFLDTVGTGAVVRIRISDHQTERVVDVKTFVYTGHYTTWLAIAGDNSPLLLRNAGTQDVYSLNWKEP